jgi:hypothetical protein
MTDLRKEDGHTTEDEKTLEILYTCWRHWGRPESLRRFAIPEWN